MFHTDAVASHVIQGRKRARTHGDEHSELGPRASSYKVQATWRVDWLTESHDSVWWSDEALPNNNNDNPRTRYGGESPPPEHVIKQGVAENELNKHFL